MCSSASLSSPPRANTQSPSAQQLFSEQPLSSQLNGTSQMVGNQPVPPATGPSPLPQQVQRYPLTTPISNTATSPMPNSSQQSQPQFPPGVKVPQAEQGMLVHQQTIGTQRPPSTLSQQLASQTPPTRSTNTFPGSLSDLVVSFENVKQKGVYGIEPNTTSYCFCSCPPYDKPRSCA
jgi:CCR4-NOT transcription complex subunit 3